MSSIGHLTPSAGVYLWEFEAVRFLDGEDLCLPPCGKEHVNDIDHLVALGFVYRHHLVNGGQAGNGYSRVGPMVVTFMFGMQPD